jgi:hypothetical protein
MSRQASPAPVASLVANTKENAERAYLFSRFESVAQCIAHLPFAYRSSLKTKFFALADVAEKHGRVCKTYHTLRHHQQTGTYPPQLEAVHEPIFQFTKEFLEYEQHIPDADNLAVRSHNVWASFRSDTLNTVIERKRSELAFLEKKLHPATFREDILSAVRAVWEAQRRFSGLVNVREEDSDVLVESGSGTATPTQAAPAIVPGDHQSAWMDTDYMLVKIDAIALAIRVVNITRSRDMAEIEKSLHKLTLQSAAIDVDRDALVLRRQQDDKAFDEKIACMVQSALAKNSEYSYLSSDDEEEIIVDKTHRGQGQKGTHAEKRQEEGKTQEKAGISGHGKESEEVQKGQNKKKEGKSLNLSSLRFDYRRASTFPNKLLRSHSTRQ